MLSIEKWQPCPGFKGHYEVSNQGGVRRIFGTTGTYVGKQLKPYGECPTVSLSVSQKISKRLVSRLVCEAFHGKPPTPKHQAAHWDGDSKNNTATNLRWATQAENEQDKKRHGRWNHSSKGSKHKDAKLHETDIPEIRRAYILGVSGPKIAKRYGVDHSTIYKILRGRSWSHV